MSLKEKFDAGLNNLQVKYDLDMEVIRKVSLTPSDPVSLTPSDPFTEQKVTRAFAFLPTDYDFN